jgi:hypothetical protein
VKRSDLNENWWFSKCPFVVFVVFVEAGCIVYVSCNSGCALCVICYLSVVSLYYCHRVKAQLQFNKYIYIHTHTHNPCP